MKRRLLSIILIILLALSFASCGIEVKKAGSSNNNQKSDLEDVGGIKEDEAQGNEADETTDDMDEPAKAGKIKESELPEDFRTDLVPIFKGSVIAEVEEDTDHLMNILTCYSDKPFSAVEAFYKEIMSNYSIQEEQEDTASYYVAGYISDLDFMMIQVADLSKEDYPDKPKNAKTGFQLVYQRLKK